MTDAVQVHTRYEVDVDEYDDIDPWDYIDAKSMDDLEKMLIRDASLPEIEISIIGDGLQELWDAILAARAKEKSP